MTHLSVTYYDSVIGLGLIPLPLALRDDPSRYYEPEPINRLTVTLLEP
jgi:hypothetical protein